MANQWIAAAQLRRALAEQYDQADQFGVFELCIRAAENVILNRLRWGQTFARARNYFTSESDPDDDFGIATKDNEYNNYVIPPSFWKYFHVSSKENKYSDWIVGDFRFSHRDWHNNNIEGTAFSVELDAAAFPTLAISNPIPLQLVEDHTQTGNSGRGRPVKWDWDGAMAHLVAIANLPDGLDTLAEGELRQADIERAMSEWFARTANDSPSISQIRGKAQAVMRAIALVEKDGRKIRNV